MRASRRPRGRTIDLAVHGNAQDLRRAVAALPRTGHIAVGIPTPRAPGDIT